jgi:tRNA A37 threonylcarbamoyladenosine dehydratase
MSTSEISSRTSLLLGPDACSSLAAARILLVSIGGVGSDAAEALALAGIGNLTLIDGDVIHCRIGPSTAENVNPAICSGYSGYFSNAFDPFFYFPGIAIMVKRCAVFL